MRTFDPDTVVALLCLGLGYACIAVGALGCVAGQRALGAFGFVAAAAMVVSAFCIGLRRMSRERARDEATTDLLVRAARDGTIEALVREAKRQA